MRYIGLIIMLATYSSAFAGTSGIEDLNAKETVDYINRILLQSSVSKQQIRYDNTIHLTIPEKNFKGETINLAALAVRSKDDAIKIANGVRLIYYNLNKTYYIGFDTGEMETLMSMGTTDEQAAQSLYTATQHLVVQIRTAFDLRYRQEDRVIRQLAFEKGQFPDEVIPEDITGDISTLNGILKKHARGSVPVAGGISLGLFWWTFDNIPSSKGLDYFHSNSVSIDLFQTAGTHGNATGMIDMYKGMSLQKTAGEAHPYQITFHFYRKLADKSWTRTFAQFDDESQAQQAFDALKIIKRKTEQNRVGFQHIAKKTAYHGNAVDELTKIVNRLEPTVEAVKGQSLTCNRSHFLYNSYFYLKDGKLSYSTFYYPENYKSMEQAVTEPDDTKTVAAYREQSIFTPSAIAGIVIEPNRETCKVGALVLKLKDPNASRTFVIRYNDYYVRVVKPVKNHTESISVPTEVSFFFSNEDTHTANSIAEDFFMVSLLWKTVE